MPKRVIDFDALWASDKLASCAEWAQGEYAWLYGLADASGSFEMTNLRVIWGRVAAIRKNLTLERLQEIFNEFIARGLLFTWVENGKRYGHWTGSDVPGRLPRRSWRARLEKLAPPVPREALAAYSARFGGSKEVIVTGARAASPSGGVCDPPMNGPNPELEDPRAGLTQEREEAHAQDLGLDLGLDLEKEKTVCSVPPISVRFGGASSQTRADRFEDSAEELLEIYEAERRELPPAGALTPERRRRCERWLAAGFTLQEFRAAVRRSAATPFLAGEGGRGWRASFDWLIANRDNARKVLGGAYAPSAPSRRTASPKSRAERRGLADLYAGVGPQPADCGVRVNPAVLERIRARQTSFEREKRRDDHVLFAPDNNRAPGQEGRGAPGQPHQLGTPEIAPKPAAFDAQPRASPAILKS